MSAICGIIHIDGKPVSLENGKAMMDKLDIYKLDSKDICLRNQVFFGCGIQYITIESEKEKLPFFDESTGLTITADAIIDNRTELFALLDISEEPNKCITDSELILLAYKKWGQDCPKFLLGDFAFAIWDEKKKKLFCTRDHVGKRTFYYYYSNNIFAFCTVIKPLFVAYDKDVSLNERWVTDFLALQGVLHESECNETIYKDIYQLPPAYTIILDCEGIKKNQYWNPLKEVQPLRLKSDKEYDEAFKKVFFEAVHCRLRSSNEVGIMLSGGLDSGSVACIAASKLSQEGKKIKAFSSIPMLKYKDNLSKCYTANESDFIEAISNSVDNIDVTYCRSEGKHSLTNIESFINILEQPYKTIENLFWYNEIIETASENGCKVLLDGQYGNCTISYGDFFIHALTLYREKRILTLIKEIRSYSKLKNIHPYIVSKAVTKMILPYKFRKAVSSKLNKNYDRFSKVPVNSQLVKKWNVEKRFDEENLNQRTQRYFDLYETHKQIVNPVAFSHIGAMETKLSLANGIVKRDPTRDKRVIEFCLSLPTEQFVKNGQERYLIRRSMEGILPDKVRLNISTRGLQSADWIQRLIPEWEHIYDELEACLSDSDINAYIDVDKLKKELSSIRDIPDEKKGNTIRMLIISLVFSYFLKNFYKYK